LATGSQKLKKASERITGSSRGKQLRANFSGFRKKISVGWTLLQVQVLPREVSPEKSKATKKIPGREGPISAVKDGLVEKEYNSSEREPGKGKSAFPENNEKGSDGAGSGGKLTDDLGFAGRGS